MAEKKVIEGVFIEGKPLEEHLIDEERDEKSHAIEEIRKSVEGRYKKAAIYSSERKAVDTRRVSKRVVRFTDRQIRKEYGIMTKPFKANSDNCIWVILEKGPVSVVEIGREMEWTGKYNSLSAMTATVWARLGNTHEGAAGILDRYSEGGKYYYQKAAGVDVSIEAAIEKYKLVGTRQYQAKMLKKKGSKNKQLQSSKEKVAMLPEDKKIPKPAAALSWDEPVNSAVEDIIKKNPVALRLEVSGQVDIVLRFEK